jgi:hypothetical protein
MKRIFLALAMTATLFGCSNTSDKKADTKALMDEIMQIHNKVMASDEKLMQNKMKLDTLLKNANLPAKDTAALISTKLVAADSAMENWMHKFEPDPKGKTDDEVTGYLNDQKKQITAIDSQITTAIAQSDKYLLKVKSK